MANLNMESKYLSILVKEVSIRVKKQINNKKKNYHRDSRNFEGGQVYSFSEVSNMERPGRQLKSVFNKVDRQIIISLKKKYPFPKFSYKPSVSVKLFLCQSLQSSVTFINLNTDCLS